MEFTGIKPPNQRITSSLRFAHIQEHCQQTGAKEARLLLFYNYINII